MQLSFDNLWKVHFVFLEWLENWKLWEILCIEAKKVLLNIILIRKNLISIYFQHTIYSMQHYCKSSFIGRPRQLVPGVCFKMHVCCKLLKCEHGNQLARSSDETSFVVAYVNCVLKVSANELFCDQMALIYKLIVS